MRTRFRLLPSSSPLLSRPSFSPYLQKKGGNPSFLLLPPFPLLPPHGVPFLSFPLFSDTEEIRCGLRRDDDLQSLDQSFLLPFPPLLDDSPLLPFILTANRRGTKSHSLFSLSLPSLPLDLFLPSLPQPAVGKRKHHRALFPPIPLPLLPPRIARTGKSNFPPFHVSSSPFSPPFGKADLLPFSPSSLSPFSLVREYKRQYAEQFSLFFFFLSLPSCTPERGEVKGVGALTLPFFPEVFFFSDVGAKGCEKEEGTRPILYPLPSPLSPSRTLLPLPPLNRGRPSPGAGLIDAFRALTFSLPPSP